VISINEELYQLYCKKYAIIKVNFKVSLYKVDYQIGYQNR